MSTCSVSLTDLAECSALIRVPPLLRNAPVKQGSFALVGLCCPGRRHYYDPLRLPLGRLSFPGSPVIERQLPGPQTRGRGGSPQFPRRPSDRSMSLNAGGFVGTRSRFSGAVRGLRLGVAGSAPPWPRLSPGVHLRRRKLRFRYGPVSCSPSHKGLVTPLRRSGSPPPPGASYRGPWRLPGPDLHRLADVSFAASVVGYVIAATSTSVAPTRVCAHHT